MTTGIRPVLATGTYRVDPTRSTVTFAIKELGLITVRGRLPVHAGTVVVAENRLRSSVTATVDVNGIRTGNDRRDKDLRAPKFLDIDAHPVMTFESTGLAGRGAGSWELSGTLIVRGTAAPVVLTVTETPGAGTGVLRGTARVDRYAHGVTAGKGLISRWVDVAVEIVLSPAAAR